MILVQYACPACPIRFDAWVKRPIPAAISCARCGRPARRRFGGSLLRGVQQPAVSKPHGGPDCHGVPDIPGSCVLSPTAARALSARARRDNRALEAEIAYQEAAIADGTLDPTASPVTPYHGHAGPKKSPPTSAKGTI